MKKGAAKSSKGEYDKRWSVQSREHFNFFGLYYRVHAGNLIFPCRSVLDIIHKDIQQPPSVGDPYDLLVVMMNPGSSLTADEVASGFTLNNWIASPQPSMTNPDAHQHGRLIEDPSDIARLEIWQKVSEPDDVQGSICKVLLNTNMKHARILNLIDIRHPDSSTVPKIYKLANKSGFVECSVFAPDRAEDLKRLIRPLGKKDNGQEARAAVIAHGNLKALADLAKEATTTLENQNITVLAQKKSPEQMMHPGRKSPEQWVEPITEQLLKFMSTSLKGSKASTHRQGSSRGSVGIK